MIHELILNLSIVFSNKTTCLFHYLASTKENYLARPTVGNLINRKTKNKNNEPTKQLNSLLTAVQPVLLTSQFNFGINTQKQQQDKNNTDFLDIKESRKVSSASNLKKSPRSTIGRSLTTFRTLSLQSE